jgi:hypothetical protein
MVSILMQLDEKDCQPLGSIELNERELYKAMGRQYGMATVIRQPESSI